MKNVGKILDQYLGTWPGFNWAASNCCHFCAGWVEICEGNNPMASLTDQLTELSAYRIIHSLGGFESAVTHFLGRQPVKMPQLQIGDLVLRPLENGRASLGIVSGRHAAFGSTDKVAFIELTSDMVGWKVNK